MPSLGPKMFALFKQEEGETIKPKLQKYIRHTFR